MTTVSGEIEVVLREAGIVDLPQVWELARTFATSFTPEATAFESSFRTILELETALLIVAERNGTCLAYALGFCQPCFYANGTVLRVEEIMVHESVRRLGIGRRLMIQMENWARTRSAKISSLATRRAGEFYTRIGYEESATYFKKLL